MSDQSLQDNRSLVKVPIDQLKPHPSNPRSRVSSLSGLASVAQLGILNPLIVKRDGDDYIVLSGHRRLAAAKKYDAVEASGSIW